MRVIPRIDLRGRKPADLTRTALTGVLPRAALDVEAAVMRVRPMCEDIKHRGAAAVREYTLRFDGVDLASTRVPQAALDAALAALDADVRAGLEEAVRRTTAVHSAQVPQEVATHVAGGGNGGGLTVTGRFIPVGRAGVYVPGGLVAYPSSVVMNVVPAQVAGVGEIAVASPPQKDGPLGPGLPHPVVLAACALLGIREVHAAGGAQALAMFAYGTEDCASADVITGPGNVYVTAAKRVLRGVVGIDGENGPTEVAIIADGTADPVHVAADLIAQAEHDELAGCLLITPDEELAGRVDAELARQVPLTRHRARVEMALAGQSGLGGQSGCVLVDDIDAALAVSDAWAPEHLEIQARDADKLARRVRNAGAIFAGAYAPVSLGDYLAGSNHVLPTGGTARHTSGLSVFPFLRLVNVIECDRDTLAATAPLIDAIGGSEDLAAHVAAVRVRVGGSGGHGGVVSPGGGTAQ
ncbi:MAG TPA: histidinol dehydrogenase [Streptosporangiaceae bacterium]|jgi:histidinol dehydrogenase|nr:histidinol dehydrogenase [Streptosporangiaceae bacterium]